MNIILALALVIPSLSNHNFENIENNLNKNISEVKKIYKKYNKIKEREKYYYIKEPTKEISCMSIWKILKGETKKINIEDNILIDRNLEHIKSIKTCIKMGDYNYFIHDNFGLNFRYLYKNFIIFKDDLNHNNLEEKGIDIISLNRKRKQLISLYKIHGNDLDIIKEKKYGYKIKKKNWEKIKKFEKKILKYNLLFVKKINNFFQKNNIKQNLVDGWKNGKIINNNGDGVKCGVYTTTVLNLLFTFYDYSAFETFADKKVDDVINKNKYNYIFDKINKYRLDVNKKNSYIGMYVDDYENALNYLMGYSKGEFKVINENNKNNLLFGNFSFPISNNKNSNYEHAVLGIKTIHGWYYYLTWKGKFVSENELNNNKYTFLNGKRISSDVMNIDHSVTFLSN